MTADTFRSRSKAAATLMFVSLVSACASPVAVPVSKAPVAADTGLDRMERLTLTANRCWFKSGDPAFARYSLAPELSSFSGRPRFLLVPKGQIEARPLLVVEGLRGSAAVETYGPLLQTALRARLEADIGRWSSGEKDCRST